MRGVVDRRQKALAVIHANLLARSGCSPEATRQRKTVDAYDLPQIDAAEVGTTRAPTIARAIEDGKEVTMDRYPSHPAAEIFPMMNEAELQELADDIKATGQREPIVLFEGQVLDGRNRLRACELAGVEPLFTKVESIGDPHAFVVTMNLRRRHLTESQRAMIAAKIATLSKGTNQHASIEAPSQSAAAEMLNVGRASVQRAREVVDHGTPELVSAVEHGEVKVAAAAEVAKLPKETQVHVVKAGPKAIKAAAKKIRSEPKQPMCHACFRQGHNSRSPRCPKRQEKKRAEAVAQQAAQEEADTRRDEELGPITTDSFRQEVVRILTALWYERPREDDDIDDIDGVVDDLGQVRIRKLLAFARALH